MAVADQESLDLARENAELRRLLVARTAERDEALAQQTATAEVLQVINSSPGDLAPVFGAILEKAHTLCGAVQGAMFLFDGEHLRAVATRGMPEAFNSRMRAGYRAADFQLTQPLLAGEPFNHIVDLALLDHPVARAAVELTGAHTVLAVALRQGSVLLGQIIAARREVRPFTNEQIALLQNFAAQAVIAMENARLITETREALEQQTATAEVLQVINSSPGDLAPVFDSMVERAARLCEADEAALRTFDGEMFHLVAIHGGNPTDLQRMQQLGPVRGSDGDSFFRRITRGEHIVHIHDIRETDVYRNRADIRQRFDVRGIRTWLAVSLHKGDAVLGALIVHRRQVQPFSHKQIALLQNFAAQAVIAIENARLITETREALDQQTATAEVLQVINASPGDLAPVFDAMLERALRLCNASRGHIWGYDGEGLTPLAIRGGAEVGEWFRQVGRLIPSPETPLGRVVWGEDLVHIGDITKEPAYDSLPLFRRYVDAGHLRTLLTVPLRQDGTLFGTFGVYRQEVQPFTEKQIALLQNFAAQAVIAMENARLITETREALEQQTATAEVLQVINASPGDLAPVFDAILDKAQRVCGVDHAALELFDGERFQAVAVHGASDRFAETLRHGYRAADSPAGRALLEGQRFAQIADAAQIDHIAFRTAAEVDGIHTVLFVPLRRDNALLGMIASARREVRPFSDKEIALLENFAAQAVIAMENARLLGELRARTDEVAGWNRELEDRVAAQLGELERVGRLKRFLAPQLAELIVARGDEGILETHRRDIVVVFCDLRGFTAFAETAEPEEVLDLLREYHGALGPIVGASEGTLDHFSGDGIMVFFNDPVPVPDASERAVRMAVAMRSAMARLQAQWRRQGREIGFGAGIARGYATLGQIGFAERVDYTAIGTVCNLAARLCAEAKDGQILISRRVAAAAEGIARLEEVGDLALKGLMQAVAVYNIAAEQTSACGR